MTVLESLQEAINDLSVTVLRLKEQRDDLLGACKSVEPIIVAAIAFVACNAQLRQLRDAIAKAEAKP